MNKVFRPSTAILKIRCALIFHWPSGRLRRMNEKIYLSRGNHFVTWSSVVLSFEADFDKGLVVEANLLEKSKDKKHKKHKHKHRSEKRFILIYHINIFAES